MRSMPTIEFAGAIRCAALDALISAWANAIRPHAMMVMDFGVGECDSPPHNDQR